MMPKGRKSSLVIRVDGALIEEIEKRPAFRAMYRSEIANCALSLLNDGLTSERSPQTVVDLTDAVKTVNKCAAALQRIADVIGADVRPVEDEPKREV